MLKGEEEHDSGLSQLMESKRSKPPLLEIHMVTEVDSPEFSVLRWALLRSSVIGLDAEWKPSRNHHSGGSVSVPSPTPSFPTVTLLQIACRVPREPAGPAIGDSPVFLVDLLSIPLNSVWELLRDMFVSPHVLKLGFRFKQDLVYLSSTFSSQGCHPGFDRVEPFLDITSIYHLIKDQKVGRKLPKETKSLAAICEEMLEISLSKEFQCSDWSCRPLTEEQISYAAADVYYLLELFAVFKLKFLSEVCAVESPICTSHTHYHTGKTLSNLTIPSTSSESIGLKELLVEANICDKVLRIKFCNASDMVKSSAFKIHLSDHTATTLNSWPSCRNILPLDECVSKIVRSYGEIIMLMESDKRPGTSRRKGRRQTSVNPKCKEKLEYNDDWQGPPLWDLSIGGDGRPKFLCDVMVEGLARHLRCVGIDAAIPSSKKPEPRKLLDQAYKEKRVLLTRDAKLLKHQYLIQNQVYRVKNLLKNDQLLEVIETFGLEISEEQLMSRCTKCNGTFILKPLTTEEAIAASRGFQVIPQCLFNKNLEFWQCTDCNQLYWEGTQYHNAVQKFVTVCKLND